jgi:hypothetical protein
MRFWKLSIITYDQSIPVEIATKQLPNSKSISFSEESKLRKIIKTTIYDFLGDMVPLLSRCYAYMKS